MSTLSLEGLVYLADALDRRQLVRLAPAVTVSHVLTRARTAIATGVTHTITEIADLPDGVAKALLFSVVSGEASLAITRDGSTVSLDAVGTVIMLDVTDLEAIEVTASADDTVYDLIVGGYEVV